MAVKPVIVKFQSTFTIIPQLLSHQDSINNKNKFSTRDNSPMSLRTDATMISGVQAMFGCPFLYFIHLSITGHSSLLQDNNKHRHVCMCVLSSASKCQLRRAKELVCLVNQILNVRSSVSLILGNSKNVLRGSLVAQQ